MAALIFVRGRITKTFSHTNKKQTTVKVSSMSEGSLRAGQLAPGSVCTISLLLLLPASRCLGVCRLGHYMSGIAQPKLLHA